MQSSPVSTEIVIQPSSVDRVQYLKWMFARNVTFSTARVTDEKKRAQNARQNRFDLHTAVHASFPSPPLFVIMYRRSARFYFSLSLVHDGSKPVLHCEMVGLLWRRELEEETNPRSWFAIGMANRKVGDNQILFTVQDTVRCYEGVKHFRAKNR